MNDSGQLGDGTTVDRPSPVEVVGLSNVVEIAVAAGHACGLLGDGHVMCWGANGGALGNGSTNNSALPVPVVGIP
jgi:alpha-tubulin suppressor-like RCC1 family protein